MKKKRNMSEVALAELEAGKMHHAKHSVRVSAKSVKASTRMKARVEKNTRLCNA